MELYESFMKSSSSSTAYELQNNRTTDDTVFNSQASQIIN